jgi:hypothetical protein
MYAVYNHNGTLLGEFKTMAAANREVAEYRGATGNSATVVCPTLDPAIVASDVQALVGVKPKVMEIHPDAKKMFDKVIDASLPSLFFRWKDERGHEDFKDYAAVMARWCDGMGVTFETGCYCPFGFIFVVNDGRRYQIMCNSRTGQIRRLVNA